MNSGIDIVTGAFSYSGKYITRRLLDAGRQVRTMTGHPERSHPFGERVSAIPYDFDNPSSLAEALRDIDTLYNTYWIRFPYGAATYEQAVQNSRILFQAAKNAGVRRIVHVSIANPSKSSPLAYYAGKARVEEALLETGVPSAIFRPTVIFGQEDVLINNIAWMVRHFPVFAIPGNGRYGIRPIYVEDLADAMVQAGQTTRNFAQDAVGPESYSFDDLVRLIAKHLGKKITLIHLSPGLTFGLTALLGRRLGDMVLTREEISGLMDNLLASQEPTLGETRLSEWIQSNKGTLGAAYVSEIKRHF